MRYSTQFVTTALMVAGLLATVSATVRAQDSPSAMDTAQRVNAANALVQQGEFDAAIEQYAHLTASPADQDTLNYNVAVANYRNGDLGTAESLFTETSKAADTHVAADSRYNLGNCQYAKALRTADQDKPAAIGELREAIASYRSSLRLNGDNPDARANIELAAEMIRRLEKEQKQEEQKQQAPPQNDQQQNEQNQDQQQHSEDAQSQDNQSQQDSQQDQQSQQDQNQSGSEGSESDQQQQSEQNKPQQQNSQDESVSGQQRSDEQQSNDSEDKQQQNEQQQSGSESEQKQQEPQSEDQSEHSQQQMANRSDSQQQRSESQNSQQQSADAQTAEEADAEAQTTDSEPTPNGELTAASEQVSDQKSNRSVAVADPNAKDGMMTKEEAMKMLQAVRDRDMLRRLRQERLERSRHVPVDRDW